MRFTTDELMTLSPEAVADYLQRHGWRRAREMKGRGAIWLYHDDEGSEFEIMLPTNRELGDFAIRMSEAIYTLAAIEERELREVYSTLADQPLAILDAEIVAKDLAWNSNERERLKPLADAIDHAIFSETLGNLLQCMGEIAESLSRGETLIGSDSSKKSVIWQGCRRILSMGGQQFKANASRNGLWKEARRGEATDWFIKNTRPRETSAVATQQSRAGRDRVT
jgi:hypothetical protein